MLQCVFVFIQVKTAKWGILNHTSKRWHAKAVSFGSLGFLSKISQVCQIGCCGLLPTESDLFTEIPQWTNTMWAKSLSFMLPQIHFDIIYLGHSMFSFLLPERLALDYRRLSSPLPRQCCEIFLILCQSTLYKRCNTRHMILSDQIIIVRANNNNKSHNHSNSFKILTQGKYFCFTIISQFSKVNGPKRYEIDYVCGIEFKKVENTQG